MEPVAEILSPFTRPIPLPLSALFFLLQDPPMPTAAVAVRFRREAASMALGAALVALTAALLVSHAVHAMEEGSGSSGGEADGAVGGWSCQNVANIQTALLQKHKNRKCIKQERQRYTWFTQFGLRPWRNNRSALISSSSHTISSPFLTQNTHIFSRTTIPSCIARGFLLGKKTIN